MKRVFCVFLAAVFLAAAFSGCASIKYKKGVDYDNFPDKEIPIYDDAVVFYFEEDDGEWELKYGTDDDVDDVADFYREEFEDEDYVITDEDEDKDEYSVEGYVDEYEFEIDAEEASGEAKDYFDTVVKISVEENDDWDEEDEDEQEDLDDDNAAYSNSEGSETAANKDAGTSLSQDTGTQSENTEEENVPLGYIDEELVGMWQLASTTLDTLVLEYGDYGIAMELLADGTMHWYNNFSQNMGQDGVWYIGDDGYLYAIYDYWSDNGFCFYGTYSFTDDGNDLIFNDYMGEEWTADSWYMVRADESKFVNWYDVEQYLTDGNIFCVWVDANGNTLELFPSSRVNYGYYYADGYGGFGYYYYYTDLGIIELTTQSGEVYDFIYDTSADKIYSEFSDEYNRQ